MKLAWVVAGVMALAGADAARAQEGNAGCAAAITLAWAPVAGKAYRVAAVASGRTCAGANVTLTIRGAAGAPLLTFASAAADLPLVFAEAETPAAMAAALRRWIEQPAGRTTRDLPAWEAGEDEPKAGEAILHPEPAITRTLYADLRKWGQPTFCFVQGAESEACYALDAKADTLTLIGTKALPG